METNNEKLERVLTAKNGLKEELVGKGYTAEQVGDNIEDYPNLVKNLSVIEEAPIDGKAYLRKDGKWLDLAADGGPMRGLFEAAGAVWHPESTAQDGTKGAYWLNGLEDITIEQMSDIYNIGYFTESNLLFAFFGLNARTNIRFGRDAWGAHSSGDKLNIIRAFSDSKLEVVKLNNPTNICYPREMNLSFAYSKKMRTILGIIRVRFITKDNSDFRGCESLEDVQISELKYNISFAESSLISKESVKYMIDNSAAESPISITLHHDAYVRLFEDPDIVASLAAKPNVSLADTGAAA